MRGLANRDLQGACERDPGLELNLDQPYLYLAKINQRSGEAAPSDLVPEREPRCQVPRSRKGAEQTHTQRERGSYQQGVVLDTCHSLDLTLFRAFPLLVARCKRLPPLV
jgi:hypothetical protein